MIGFTFRQLEYFIAAEQGSVSVAPRTKHISQPSVSLALSQLEASPGEKLFHRQVIRGLELTQRGAKCSNRRATCSTWPRPSVARASSNRWCAGH